MDGELQRHGMIEALRDAQHGLDTNELAERLDLHPNTIRWHLNVLSSQGLVEALAERRHGRGRPSVVYALTGAGIAHDRDEYRLLATMLSEVVEGLDSGTAQAYDAGVCWGERLRSADPGGDVSSLLARQGFAAESHGDRIEMRRCPFAALAARSPRVVCTLHRGLIDGALRASGARASVGRLEVFVEPELCVAHLR